MGVVQRTISKIEERKRNVENNIHNSLPSPFKRFSSQFIGIERATYYLITASTKGAKSQFTNYLFMFSPVLFTFKYPKVKFKLFYFPFEETPERITSRFISYLLYIKYNKEIDYHMLMSSKNKAIPQEILDLINGEEIQAILKHYEECVEFVEGEKNPTGIYNTLKKYAEDNGEVVYRTYKKKDDLGQEIDAKAFSYYKANNPNQYTLFIVDHISLLQGERGFTTKQTMDKLSEYCVELRNHYGFSPVVVQQQNLLETPDNFKMGLTRPSLTGLSDSKYTSRDAEVVLGLYSPFRMKETNFLGYDIVRLKDSFRSLEVLANRNGETGGIIGLRFKGNVAHFEELPLPNTPEMQEKYKEIEEERKPKEAQAKDKIFSFFLYLAKGNKLTNGKYL